MSTTIDQVRRIISNTFNVPLEDVTESSSQKTIEDWDSMRQLMLVLELEQEFNRQFSPEQVERMTDVASIASIIDAS